MSVSEFDLIERIRARTGTGGEGVRVGIGDDAALLAVPAGMQLAVTADTLNAGVHFPDTTAPADIGWKALAVNLSDLAAMGARPAWCTLALSAPALDAAWLDGFLDGFSALAGEHGIALVGGDTTRGPLSISITAMGWLPPDAALRRDGARVDDDVWVTGTLGDAAAALARWLAGGEAGLTAVPALRARLDRPTPRVAAGHALLRLANAAADVSDGLLADLGHICERSGVGAEVQVDGLPMSPALSAVTAGVEDRRRWQATGGDDYELCFTAAPYRREAIAEALAQAGTTATRIGRIVAGHGVRALAAAGREWRSPRRGFDHFD